MSHCTTHSYSYITVIPADPVGSGEGEEASQTWRAWCNLWGWGRWGGRSGHPQTTKEEVWTLKLTFNFILSDQAGVYSRFEPWFWMCFLSSRRRRSTERRQSQSSEPYDPYDFTTEADIPQSEQSCTITSSHYRSCINSDLTTSGDISLKEMN